MSEHQRYGVALFETPTEYSTGWAAYGGETGNPPFYFANTGELATDVVWLTNLDGDIFFRSGLSRTPRFRHEYYLRTKVSSMILELGLKNATLDQQAVVLANIFERVMRLAEYHIGISGAPVNTLATGFRQVLNPEADLLKPELREAADRACQSFVQCMKPHETLADDHVITSLVFHRKTYAQIITSYPIPDGAWSKAPSHVLSMSNQAIIDWICETPKPVLAKVRILRLDEQVNHLLNYGSGAGIQIKKAATGSEWTGLNQREWMTTPEVKLIKEYADIIVEDVLCGEGYKKNSIKLPTWGALSYSTGILCENLWVSLTKDLAGRGAKTPLSAWIHSIDRMLCFQAAMQIEKSNLVTIHSYGYGRVTICLPDNHYRALADLGVTTRMIAPMAEKEETFVRKIPPQAKPELVIEAIMERREMDMLEKLDIEALAKAETDMNERARQSMSTQKITL